jgi:type III pantothenate kinase
MAQQLIIDIGNSSAKIALFDGDTLIEQLCVSHEALPKAVRKLAGDATIGAAIISSVIPLSEETENTLADHPFSFLRMSAQLKMPFHIAYKTPDTLGPDRLAAVAGAHAQQPGRDLLVIDVGTAITYDLITADGIYHGGQISPGINMRFKALHHFTGKLPFISREGKRTPIGSTTETAIREGVLQGVDKEIKGYIEEYTSKYPGLLVFLTGGDSFLLDNRTKSRTFADNLLVTKGLNRILTLNNEKI